MSLPRKIKPQLLGVLALGNLISSSGYSFKEKFALKKLGEEARLAIYLEKLNQNY
ncbi:MAG: hypothetical protein QNJ70_18265 [Xenococcaceae cyanobacterium MO_207.B15]|nr:hypothetical protein [Xenococcaceae cyanobacterium MO_207.B15]